MEESGKSARYSQRRALPKSRQSRRNRAENGEVSSFDVNAMPQLAPDEPLSPELVLVLAPELRAQVLARLGAPVWPAPRPYLREIPPPPAEPFARALGEVVAARLARLGLIFLVATMAVLAMSLVAHVLR